MFEETETERAHRIADEFSALAAHYQHTNFRRWRRLTEQAATWREYAHLIGAGLVGPEAVGLPIAA